MAAAKRGLSRTNYLAHKSKRSRGRPEHQPTAQLRQRVADLSVVGLSKEAIADVVELSVPTLEKHYERELRSSTANLLRKAARNLDKALEKGAPWATCFVLKTRGKQYGWTERHEHTGKDGDPLLPDLKGLSDEQLAKLAEARRIIGSIASQVADRAGAETS